MAASFKTTAVKISLIRFLCIEYLVGNKAVQVLKLVLISFRAFRYFLCSFVQIETLSSLFTVS